MTKILALTIGSVAGGLARYYLAGFMHHVFGSRFPYGTLAVNLVGCFLVGIFSILLEKKFLIGPEAKLLLMVGFCGAFTTFSTFMLETSSLLDTGESARAFLNILLSVTAGFFVFRWGVLLGEAIKTT